jgi:hypothetical protein
LWTTSALSTLAGSGPLERIVRPIARENSVHTLGLLP